jgi:ribonuclease BN (tRNA processing enzyme)
MKQVILSQTQQNVVLLGDVKPTKVYICESSGNIYLLIHEVTHTGRIGYTFADVKNSGYCHSGCHSTIQDAIRAAISFSTSSTLYSKYIAPGLKVYEFDTLVEAAKYIVDKVEIKKV